MSTVPSTHRTGRHALHGLGVELEVARLNNRVDMLGILGQTRCTTLFTHFAFFLFCGGRLSLLTGRNTDTRTQQGTGKKKDDFSHSTRRFC